jgi:hypothetical protein
MENKTMKNKQAQLILGKNQVSKKVNTQFYLVVCLLTFICLGLTHFVQAQNQPKITHKSWTSLGETSNRIDVSYSVVKCDLGSPNQVLISILNENATAQNLSMTLLIKNNSNNVSFSSTITFSAGAAAMVKPDCSVSTATAPLKITLPAGYNPADLTVTATFN